MAMRKYLALHTVPVGAYSYEQICQLADAAQHESDVRGYRSFFNLAEGKICCVMEAESQEAIVAWFEKMGIPYDGIWPVEIEGDRGVMKDLRPEAAKAEVS
jgi:hypothetical protein